jgi:phospholipid/cholesterol/gamma-HCH transport system ATP-binding protein
VLLKIIIGLQTLDSGSVHIHGRDISGLSLDQLGGIRRKMGFLFQHSALYDSLTVEQNVAFPLQHNGKGMSSSEQNNRVRQLLAEVGMERHLDKMPSDISGGMQKRVGLARALALEPDILLLDEPTAGLDPISSAEIDELVLKLQAEHQMASIVVTHDLYSAKTIAGRLILLNDGTVTAEGTFQELQGSDDKFVRDFFKHS